LNLSVRRSPLSPISFVATVLCVGLICAVPFVKAQTKPLPVAAPLVQAFDATNLREPVEIGTQGLVQAGDDPAWARPDFDDSKWVPVDAKTQLSDYFPNNRTPVIWRRLHVKVSPADRGLALQAYSISRAFEVYVNGQKLMQSGQVAPFVPYTRSARMIVRIPEAQLRTGSLLIAIRQYVSRPAWDYPGPSFDAEELALGQESALRDQASLSVIRGYAGFGLEKLLAVGVGLVALVLFSVQRRQSEYFWIFGIGATLGAQVLVTVLLAMRNFPAEWNVLSSLLGYLGNLTLLLGCQALLRKRFSRRVWLFIAASFLLALAASVANRIGSLPSAYMYAANIPIALILDLILPWLFLRRLRSGDREAGILLVPLLTFGLVTYASIAITVLQEIPAARAPANDAWDRINSLHVGIFYFSLNEDASLVFWCSLGIIIVRRFTRTTRKQAVLEGEMAAAREVQQVILPEKVESVPGFEIETAYRPAQEVGGDFFQILPAGKGGLLVVVGDVAGKGLPAAMLVSLLVGAIRGVAEYTKDPGELLANLNQRLVGRGGGGFSTALVAHITADGWVTIANAGHLSPYLDGREVELPGALPLGVMNGATYDTTDFPLPHGSRITFYSDGVIEAQNQQGELFGFERAQALSTQSAAAIVDAAKQFGQEDDITVVTVERHAVFATAA